MHLTGEQLDKYVMGELSGMELSHVTDHLSTCRECSEQAVFLEQFREKLQASRFIQGVVEGEHPAEKKILDYVAGVLRADEREALDLHFRQCHACAALLPASSEIREFETYLKEHARVDDQHPVGASLYGALARVLASRWTRVAAGFAIAGVVAFILLRPPASHREEPMHERIEGSTDIVHLIAPDHASARLPFIFRWLPYEDATSYHLLVTKSDDPTIAYSFKTDTTFVPSDSLPYLEGGTRYEWRVQAYIGSRMIGESESQPLFIEK